VARVVRSGQLAQGPEVEALEQAMAEREGYRHGVAVSSGSAALQLGLLALGVGPGSRVAVPSYVCVAALHAVENAGAGIDLVDVATADYHPSPQALQAACGPDTRAIILPHLFGYRAALGPLIRCGIPVLDDLAMGAGSVERCRERGRIAVHSFYATKPLASGEGGILLTNSARIANRLRDLRSYDKKSRHARRFNFKLTELQAALVRSQLKRLDRAVTARRRLAERYFEGLSGCPGLSLPVRDPQASYYRFVVRSSCSYARLSAAYGRFGIEIARPVHRPLHRLLRFDRSRFPQTESLYLTAFSLPIYPRLQVRDLLRVVDATWTILAGDRGHRR
jgi:dTDP-4-amino-4,6-dideoxygalactose transaminase